MTDEIKGLLSGLIAVTLLILVTGVVKPSLAKATVVWIMYTLAITVAWAMVGVIVYIYFFGGKLDD